MWSMQISAQTTPHDALEEMMSCADFAQCYASKMGCNAGSWLESAEIVKWPHLMLFEMGNFHVDLSINSIEECFTWRNKKFLLRGAILGDDGHFTTLLRMPNGWMHFDDMARPKFKFCKKEEDRVAIGEKNHHLCCF